ncbi:hypothetical protein VTK73DRAFT_3194 [Phialemonium thermophilum]|uniref:Uncharacterized protein n=1 Tax=Phialemonium thermophilum TaxID=223376 RepID=A0ABR3VL76_9PEZI
MTLGHASLAVSQYCRALKHRPLNIRTVRNLADVALDTRDPRQNSAVARDAYRRIIDYCKAHGTTAVEEGDFEWSDLRIYLEFFHMLEQWADAARELREVARWLLGREAQGFWDRWPDDDREWDINDDRRVEIPEYQPAQFPLESYGMGLPVDLRARLCMYRLKLGHESEAALHLQVLDPADRYHPQDVPALERFRYFPDCLKDVGAALLERSRPAEAIEFFELYRRIAAGNEDVLVDADLLVHQGRCYLALEDKVAAEECFIAAIEEDDGNIDARFELAKIYEGEQEKEGREEAFLLVNEALHLEAQQGGGEDPQQEASRRAAHRRLPPHLSADLRRKRERLLLGQPKRRRRTYRPRRLGGSEERRKYEQERTAALADKYRLCLELKPRLESGDEEDPEAARAWMGAARELIDDFRASKDFYPWDMYVRSQGFVTLFAGQDVPPHANAKLLAMAARLQQNLAPGDGQEHAPPPVIVRHEHRGIPFDEWLDLFLDYALRLAREGQVREAYEICMSAKDSVVFKSKENSFLIHLAHATCAVIAGDEEQCVSVARYFMREYMHCTDSYRIVAALCRVCQTPVSWYSSGPAQKFILRQIRHMDKATLSREAGGENAGVSGLDVCLLTIYGHIMFTTTSYTYALSWGSATSTTHSSARPPTGSTC